LAFIQEWAQKAIRYPGAAKTFISLKSTPLDNGMAELRLEIFCREEGNEAVKAVLASPAIRDRVQMLGGRFEAIREADGIRAFISLNVGGVGA
jgi:hypothetical protein